jgi:hypothetical protein
MDMSFVPSQPATDHPRRQKCAFSTTEDLHLTELVQQFGETSWHEIEKHFPGRSARQCRDRWNLYLSPNVSKEPWTPDEDALLLRWYQLAGPKWTTIAKQFPAKTAHNIKNRHKQLQRKIQRMSRFTGRLPEAALLQPPLPFPENFEIQPSQTHAMTLPMSQEVGSIGGEKSE